MKDFFRALFGNKAGSVNINGVSYSGDSVVISSSSMVIVNGKVVSDGALVPPIHVTITGDVERIEGAMADVTVSGWAGSVETMSGSVRCGSVAGDVETMSGDVTCGDVAGSVSTMSGDVRMGRKP